MKRIQVSGGRSHNLSTQKTAPSHSLSRPTKQNNLPTRLTLLRYSDGNVHDSKGSFSERERAFEEAQVKRIEAEMLKQARDRKAKENEAAAKQQAKNPQPTPTPTPNATQQASSSSPSSSSSSAGRTTTQQQTAQTGGSFESRLASLEERVARLERK